MATNKRVYDQLDMFAQDINLKDRFLYSIRTSSTARYKYKRVVTSPIRYPGGKSLGVGFVLELLPDNVNRVVSPFFGGGSIEIAMSKYLGLEVIGYDIFNILTNYWEIQIKKPKLLYERLSLLKPDQETYDRVKALLEDHWDKATKTYEKWSKRCNRSIRYKSLQEKDKLKEWKTKQILDPLDLAVYYFFNYNLSYGPGFLGWSASIYLNEKKYNSMLKKVRNFKPKNLKIECADFKDVIKEYPNDFLYCDPPYYIGESSKMFRGVYPMRNIPIHHDGFEHVSLAELLNNHKGGFILSYNDCNQVREWYKNFKHYFPKWQYTMGQGETRIGDNRLKEGIDHIKESHEIIIFKEK